MKSEERRLRGRLGEIRAQKELLDAEEVQIERKLAMIDQGERIQRIVERGW